MFTNKLVAVMNGKIDAGVIMNALAHMCIGFGAEIGKENLRLTTYVDADDDTHPSISEMPFIILYSGGLNLGKKGCKESPVARPTTSSTPIESGEEENAANGIQICSQNFPKASQLSIKAKNSNKIVALRQAAAEAGIQCVDFTDTMTIGTYQEQLERTKKTKAEDLIYYGIVLFGDWHAVSELTKKFSLWK